MIYSVLGDIPFSTICSFCNYFFWEIIDNGICIYEISISIILGLVCFLWESTNSHMCKSKYGSLR